MSKKRVGLLYNKPVVTGDTNLVNPNEIHEKDLNSNQENSSDVLTIKGNNYYWKSNLDITKYNTDTYEVYVSLIELLLSFGVFSAYCVYSTKDTEVASKTRAQNILYTVNSQSYTQDGSSGNAKYTLKVEAFRECDFDVSGTHFNSIYEYIKSESGEMSEEAFLAQMKSTGWDRISAEEYNELIKDTTI